MIYTRFETRSSTFRPIASTTDGSFCRPSTASIATPTRLDNNGGRGHWGGICPLVLAGGGLRTGQVVGQSARNGDVPNSDPITIRDLMATITHTIFDVGQLRLQAQLPREIIRLTETGRPIGQLVG